MCISTSSGADGSAPRSTKSRRGFLVVFNSLWWGALIAVAASGKF